MHLENHICGLRATAHTIKDDFELSINKERSRGSIWTASDEVVKAKFEGYLKLRRSEGQHRS